MGVDFSAHLPGSVSDEESVYFFYMSFHGSLNSIPIPDLFALLLQLRKTGVLSIVGEQEERGFLFYEGNLVYATTQDDSRRLGNFLVRLGFLDEEELGDAFGSSGGEYLGQRVIELGRVTQDQLNSAVQAQIVDIMDEVIGWEAGAFHFDDTELPFEIPGQSLVSTQSVLLDVARRNDETGHARELFPDGNAIYAVDSACRLDTLPRDMREVLELLDGERTIERIFFESPLGPRETALVLESLVDEGVISQHGVRKTPMARSPVPEIKNLPIAPDVASKLFAVFNFEEGDDLKTKICEFLSYEPLLTAKLLKMLTLTNVQISRTDFTIPRLVELLGMFHIRCTLIPEATRGFFFPQKQWFWRELWNHSRLCALLSRKLAERTRYPHPDEAFLAGLLHNIGAFLLLHQDPSRYFQVVDEATRERRDIEAIEEKAFGISHTKLGGIYAEKWSFPAILVVVIKGHHGNMKVQSPLVHLVETAVCLLQKLGGRIDYHWAAPDQLQASLSILNLETAEVEAICQDVMRDAELSFLPEARRKTATT